MSHSSPIRVLIVDDSAVVRKMLAAALATDKQIEVVGTASDAYVARDKILALNPDVVTLDIEMPRMDGITFLRKLMHFRPLPVIIISSLGVAGARATIEALRAGAVEILCKPDGPYSVGDLGLVLADKVRAAAQSHVKPRGKDWSAAASASAAPLPVLAPGTHFDKDAVIAIGASTGGPGAIADVLMAMPPDTPPIVIVQHMPAIFTTHLANRLNQDCRIEVKEAQDNDELLPGRALIAPGGFHMTLKRIGSGYRVRIADGPLVCFSKPSVDVLFASVAAAAHKKSIGILLTGMGDDGARGLLEMRRSGALTIAQDEASCVVFGMPKEAIRLDAAQKVLPLHQIAGTVLGGLKQNAAA